MKHLVNGNFHSDDGNASMLFALSAFGIAGAVSVAMLSGQAALEKTSLQAAMDAAVLAGTALGGQATASDRIMAANRVYYAHVSKADYSSSTPEVAFASDGSSKAVFTVSKTSVSGQVSASVSNPVGAIIGISSLPVKISNKAVKQLSDQICVLSLNKSGANGIEVYGGAQFTVENCAAQANSSDGSGLHIYGNKSTATATQFGVMGGFQGSSFSPSPMTSIAPTLDPYASLPVPQPGPCVNLGNKLSQATVTLDPGTYCGGLNIKAGSQVKLNPGIYIMSGGPYNVNSGATVSGDQVMIALEGANSVINLQSGANVTLTSPISGTYKNIQFMSDRDLSQSKQQQEWSQILGGASLSYNGVMYLPEQQFWVSGTDHSTVVSGVSPTMTIVADSIWDQGNAVYDFKQADTRNIGLDAGDSHFEYGARLVY